MRFIRPILMLSVAVLAMSLPAGAELAEPKWESVGGEGAVVTGLLHEQWHGSLAFMTTIHGYRIFTDHTDMWDIHEVPGDPSRELTAVAAIPRIYQRLLMGRRGNDGHGIIEMGTPLARGDVVHTSGAGQVADLEVPGFYDPLPVACTRALDAIAGEFLVSADTGATWQDVDGHGHHDLTDLYCWSTDAIFVAGDAGVMFTPDAGATWQAFNDGLPAGTVRHLWTRGPGIAIPGKAERNLPPYLLASLDDGVYHTATDVVAWQRVLEAPAPRRILVQGDPYTGIDHVFVITDDDRLLHADQGQWQWQDLGAGLGDVEMRGVASLYPRFYVATAAAGLHRAQIFGGASDVPPAPGALELAAAPNPFNPGTTLRFVALRAGQARLTVHDLRGRLVATLIDGPVEAGPVARTWRPADLASGVYVARLALHGDVAVRRLTLVE